MKQIFKIGKLATLILALGFIGCTDNFEEYNTHPYAPTKQAPINHFPAMIKSGCVVQINQAQFVEHMFAGPYGGYYSMSNSWEGNNFATFNASKPWNQEAFERGFVDFYSNYYDVETATEKRGNLYAMALLLKVHTMHRVVDTYGPIPYTKVKRGESNIPYDSVEDVYKAMFEDLDFAIKTLTDFVTNNSIKPLETVDQVYFGDYTKWVKYANSLKLRLAIRISGVDPVTAQKRAEEAINDPIGCITSNDDNAKYNMLATEVNRDYGICHPWKDTRANASIVAYMNAYNDPRIDKYFTKTKVEDHTEEYSGLRSGVTPILKNNVSQLSNVVVEKKSPILIFRASETAFLCAEGALLGWNMGGTAKSLYEQGIKLSFSERGASDVSTFLEKSEEVELTWTSLLEYGSYTFQPLASVAWDEDAADDVKLKKLITQKWIANFSLGYEAWADYRRTGYPELIPARDNLSQGVVQTERGARRLVYPQFEYDGNQANVEKAVTTLLGGADTQATDLWWAKKD
ncbi:SusD/RagB family nutrient-binding outer membrane lipoprotein [Flavobacteriaceae bacterium]|nr:SusD/RagB family nutrient-binding outer membrane lipoprotein [Flavobacteriaceae bacterium]MDB4591092.1 SusD/RagB family nutrient-binding outer membrane lipoprotein [Flavobacteriaceae bacterium]